MAHGVQREAALSLVEGLMGRPEMVRGFPDRETGVWTLQDAVGRTLARGAIEVTGPEGSWEFFADGRVALAAGSFHQGQPVGRWYFIPPLVEAMYAYDFSVEEAPAPRPAPIRRTTAPEDDAVLVERAQSGDREAFGILYARHQKRMLRWLTWYGVPKEEAEELVQEGFVRALARLDTFRHGAIFYPWVRQIVFNVRIDRIRLASHRRPHDSMDGFEPAQGVDAHLLVAHVAGPEERVLAGDMMELVESCIGRLSDDQRAVLELFAQQYRYPEIAEALGIPEGTVMSRLYYARRRIRKLLGEDTVSALLGREVSVS